MTGSDPSIALPTTSSTAASRVRALSISRSSSVRTLWRSPFHQSGHRLLVNDAAHLTDVKAEALLRGAVQGHSVGVLLWPRRVLEQDPLRDACRFSSKLAACPLPVIIGPARRFPIEQAGDVEDASRLEHRAHIVIVVVDLIAVVVPFADQTLRCDLFNEPKLQFGLHARQRSPCQVFLCDHVAPL